MSPVYSNRPKIKSVSVEQRKEGSTLLQNSEIDTNRGIQLQAGEKAPINHENYPLETVSGNYGIYAGSGLVTLDIDDYRDGEEVPAEIRTLIEKYPTLTVSTPHGGIHLYYIVPEGFYQRIEEVAGKKNPTVGCVEIKAFNQYTVGPGSQLDGCSKEWCNQCVRPDGGYYSITEARTPVQPPAEELLSVIEDLTEEPEQTDTTVPAGDFTFTDDVEEWIQTARQTDTYLHELMQWAGSTSGTPADFNLRYEDRSQNEVALAQKLMWRFGSFKNYEQITRSVMQKLHPPKWNQSGQSYRDSVINAAKAYTVDIGEFYKSPSKDRSVAKHHAQMILLDVYCNMGDTFKTSEVAQWQKVGYDQTLRVLNDLEKAGYLTKNGYQWEKVTEVPIQGPTYEMIMNQYKSVEELQQQRSDYLNQ